MDNIDITCWHTIDNDVNNRIIDSSLSHIFSENRTINTKTKFLNDKLKQLCINLKYKKYLKIKTTIMKNLLKNGNPQDCLNINRSSIKDEFIESCDDSDKSHFNTDKTNSGNTEESSETQKDQETIISWPKIQNQSDSINKRNYDKKSKRKLDEITTTDKNYDNLILDLEKSKNIIVKISNDYNIESTLGNLAIQQNSLDHIQSRSLIQSTELKASPKQYKNTQKIQINTNNISQEHDDNSSEKNIHSRIPGCLTVPNEVQSLQYILKDLHQRHENNFLVDISDENKSISMQPQIIKSTRPINLDDLINSDNLMAVNFESTLTYEDINQDEEIILCEIPKSVIDNSELKGKIMQIEKHKVIIDNKKYEAYQKQNNFSSMILKTNKEDSEYQIGSFSPIEAIVIRQISQEKNASSRTICDFTLATNKLDLPLKTLKRRNPLLLKPYYKNFHENKKLD